MILDKKSINYESQKCFWVEKEDIIIIIWIRENYYQF